MTYGRMPLFPSCGGPRSNLQLPLFDGCGCPPPPPPETCQCVRIQNPACPGEYADVELCVDISGNLSICVRRPPKPCMPPKKRPRPPYNCCAW